MPVMGTDPRNTSGNAATHCNTPQHTAAHWSTSLQCVTVLIRVLTLQLYRRFCITLRHTATHCYTTHHTAIHYPTRVIWAMTPPIHQAILHHTATHCNALQHTASHKIYQAILHHTAPHCNTLHHTMHRTLFRPAPRCNTLHRAATHYTALQHTTLRCNTLHYTTLQPCKNTLSNQVERPIDSQILQHMASQLLQHMASQLSRCHQHLCRVQRPQHPLSLSCMCSYDAPASMPSSSLRTLNWRMLKYFLQRSSVCCSAA